MASLLFFVALRWRLYMHILPFTDNSVFCCFVYADYKPLDKIIFVAMFKMYF